MDTLFIKLINLSISASMLVLLVFVFRSFLKKTSRRATCFLWIVVALRLVIPISFESKLSIMPSGDFIRIEETAGKDSISSDESLYAASDTGLTDNIQDQSRQSVLPDGNEKQPGKIDGTAETDMISDEKTNNITESNRPDSIGGNNVSQGYADASVKDTYNNNVEPGIGAVNGTEIIPAGTDTDEHIDTGIKSNISADDADENKSNIRQVLSYVWLCGVAAFFIYMVTGYIRMKKRLSESIRYCEAASDNVYVCDRIDSAFIFGIVKPKIYIPGDIGKSQIESILSHETVHLKRKDHIWKVFGFMLLMVYWFNPFIWAAYACFCRDIEFACDESVISGMDPIQIRAYSDTLLSCSTDRHFMYSCPLAFGEVAVKDRIKAALNYKKPLFWVIAAAFVLLIGITVFFFTKPGEKEKMNSTDNGTEKASETGKENNEIPDFTFEGKETDKENTALTLENDPELSEKISDIDSEYEEIFTTSMGAHYYRLKDGTYTWADGYTYQYRLVLPGRMPGAKADVTYVILSNIENITYQQAFMASGFSSRSDDYFKQEDAVIVDQIIVYEDDTVKNVIQDPNSSFSTYNLFNKLFQNHKYNLVHDFEFTYVMPDGTGISNSFCSKSAWYLLDYIATWSMFGEIYEDESLIHPWHENKKSENGYLIISTNSEYDSSGQGYRVYVTTDYLHLFSFDGDGEKYIWSARFEGNFNPNMYSLRRILFNKDMYDIYVNHCPYDEEISGAGVYNLNRGYSLDLDGDGIKEQLFVASCGWINYPEPENIEGWCTLTKHQNGSDYYDYYGKYPDSLIYINGKLCNASAYNGIEDNNIPYKFAVTDIDKSDKRLELLIDGDPEDMFYVYGNGVLKGPEYCGIYSLRNEWLPVDRLSETKVITTFNGDGTFVGAGRIELKDYNIWFYSQSITWRMDKDGNIECVGNVFDVEAQSDLKLEYELEATADPDSSSKRVHIGKGNVKIDKTDGISKLHIQNAELSGWIDLKDLGMYVKDYETSGLKDIKDDEILRALFGNMMSLP
jgi:beta-lactamase regulating signal transducer with metallopeptidase domain